MLEGAADACTCRRSCSRLQNSYEIYRIADSSFGRFVFLRGWVFFFFARFEISDAVEIQQFGSEAQGESAGPQFIHS